MKRRLVKQGGSTMTVTLPPNWIKRFRLDSGDEVEVQEQQSHVIISTEAGKKSKNCDVSVIGMGAMVKRILGALYKTGYNEFSIRFETPEEFETAQRVIREQFVGFEVVDHKKNKLIAKRITNIETKEFDTMLRRMFIIIKLMGEDAVEAIKEKNANQLKMIALRDGDVNKIADYCRRTINKQGTINFDRPGPLYFVVEQLEKIGDAYRDLCRHLGEQNLEETKTDIDFFRLVNKLYASLYELFFKFEVDNLPGLYSLQKEIKEKSHLLFKDNNHDPRVTHYLQLISQCTWDSHGPIVTMRM